MLAKIPVNPEMLDYSSPEAYQKSLYEVTRTNQMLLADVLCFWKHMWRFRPDKEGDDFYWDFHHRRVADMLNASMWAPYPIMKWFMIAVFPRGGKTVLAK